MFDKLPWLGRRPAHWHRDYRGERTWPFCARPRECQLRAQTLRGRGLIRLADVSSLGFPNGKVPTNLIIILNVSLLRAYRVNKSLKDMVNFLFPARKVRF